MEVEGAEVDEVEVDGCSLRLKGWRDVEGV